MSTLHYCVYILQCDNGSYYTGYTTDLTRRYQEHLAGSTKCKYTRSFKPVKITQSWTTLENKSEALRIERFIKKMSKLKKNDLLLHPEQLTNLFNCQIMLVENPLT